jgi:methylmalonyl-CoA mutase
MQPSTSNANCTFKQNGLEKDVEQKIKIMYTKKITGQRAAFIMAIYPKAMMALGLYLLGVTGDQVLPTDVYEEIKTETLNPGTWYGSG